MKTCAGVIEMLMCSDFSGDPLFLPPRSPPAFPLWMEDVSSRWPGGGNWQEELQESAQVGPEREWKNRSAFSFSDVSA